MTWGAQNVKAAAESVYTTRVERRTRAAYCHPRTGRHAPLRRGGGACEPY